MSRNYPIIGLVFAISIFIMVDTLLSDFIVSADIGLIIIVASIAAIGFFSIVGFVEDRILKYFLWSCIIQIAYFFLDYGTAAATGKSIWFASLQLINYTIAGSLFTILVASMYLAVRKRNVFNYAGLYSKNPKFTLALVIACLSLGGLPAFNIFVGEFLIYSALMEVAPILAMSAIFASLLCFLFYFRLCFTVFSGDSPVKIRLGIPTKVMTVILSFLVVLLGVVPQILLYVLEMVM